MARTGDERRDSELTLDQAVQGATSNAERIAEKADLGRSSGLKVAGQIAIGFFLPWVTPRALD